MNQMMTDLIPQQQPMVPMMVTIMRVTSDRKGQMVAFGVAEDGAGVFVPSSVTGAVKPMPMQRYFANCVEGSPGHQNRWKAVRLNAPIEDRAVAPEDRGGQAKLNAEKALNIVKAGGVWTVGTLMTETLGEDWCEEANKPELNAISNLLHSAHNAGEIACASVKSSASQQRNSRLLWAKDWREFEEVAIYAR